jgi:hypothetical protein
MPFEMQQVRIFRFLVNLQRIFMENHPKKILLPNLAIVYVHIPTIDREWRGEWRLTKNDPACY